MGVGVRVRGAFSACRRRRRPRCQTARRPARIAIPRRTSCRQPSRSAAFHPASRGVASSRASAGRWPHGPLRRPCLLTAVAARLGHASGASGHGRRYQANRETEGHSPPAAKQGPPVGRPLTFKSPAAGCRSARIAGRSHSRHQQPPSRRSLRRMPAGAAPSGSALAFAQKEPSQEPPPDDRFRRRALVCRCRSA